MHQSLPYISINRLNQKVRENLNTSYKNTKLMLKFLKPKTKWGKAMLLLFVLAFVFTVIALILTVYALQSFPFAFEYVESTDSMFKTNGYYFGGLINLGSNLFFMLVIPVIMLSLLKILNYQNWIQRGISLMFVAVIEGFAIATFLTKFLDMTNDFTVIYYISTLNLDGVFKLEWLRQLIQSVWLPTALITIVFSVSFRSLRALREHRDRIHSPV